MGTPITGEIQRRGIQRPTIDTIKVSDTTTLAEELSVIEQKASTFDMPVATFSDLPLVGNEDGDIRLVLDEDKIYVWDSISSSWKTNVDKRTETRSSVITVGFEGQTNFTTDIPVGVNNGIASMNSVRLSVNGVNQTIDTDYTLGITGQPPANLIITWKSLDFLLDATDKVVVTYDILIIE